MAEGGAAGSEPSGPAARPVVVVHDRVRLFREALSAALSRQLAGVTVVAEADRAMVCEHLAALGSTVAGVVTEADGPPSEGPGSVASLLAAATPGTPVVALSRARRRPVVDGAVVLARRDVPDGIPEAVGLVAGDIGTPVGLAGRRGTDRLLTTQQRRVVTLLAAGMTVAEVAVRLGTSERSVVRAKAAIFARLGARSQGEALAVASAAGLLGPVRADRPSVHPLSHQAVAPLPGSRPGGGDRPDYQSPVLREQALRTGLPRVVVVHDERAVAAGLGAVLEGRADVVGDTDSGSVAGALVEVVQPDVVVAGELLRDGAVDAYLPALCRRPTRVVLVVDHLDEGRLVTLLRAGVDGVCTAAAGLDDLVAAVEAVGGRGAVLPPAVLARVLDEWRGDGRGSGTAPGVVLSGREREVAACIVEGMSTKATAVRLGISTKTVEHHRGRLFTKLGVRNHAELVTVWGGMDRAEEMAWERRSHPTSG